MVGLNWRDKAIAAPSKRLHEARISGRVPQGFADLVDGRVEAVIEVNKRVSGPELFAQVLAGNHVAGMFEQQSKHLERLLLEPNADAAFAEFSGLEVRLEHAKTDNAPARNRCGRGHKPPRAVV